MKTLVIVPAHNEAANLPGVLDDLRRFCPEATILVINDCSTDETSELLPHCDVKYLTLPVNLGIGGVVQTGYRYASAHHYDFVVQFDGDGQHMAQYVHDLLRPLESGQADLVIGSRFLERKGYQSTGARRFGIRLLGRLIQTLCGICVNDVTSGMRAVNEKMAVLFSTDYAQDYPEPESILTAALHGARIMEVPVQMRERQGGQSSITPLGSVYYMIKVTLALIMSSIRGEK